MPAREYTHSRTDSERRDTDRRHDYEDEESLMFRLLTKLEQKESTTDAHQGSQLTFTVPQILTGLIAIVTIGGSILAAWTAVNNDIISQKISTDLTISQMQKELTNQVTVNKDLHSKIDNTVGILQLSIDKLTTRIEDLDNTVNQLYSRTSPKK